MFGLCLVLFLAGIQKIPHTLYEAARVDGAGRVREFFAVTLPGLRGELAVALTLTTIMALRTFDLIYVSTTGGPGTSTTVPSVLVYQNAFANGRVGLGGGGRGRADGADLRRRVRDHPPRRPGPEPMTVARREQLLSYAVLGVFCVLVLYPVLSIVLLAFHKRSDLVTGFSIPRLARLQHVQDGVGGGRLRPRPAQQLHRRRDGDGRLRGAVHARRLRVRRDALPRLRRALLPAAARADLPLRGDGHPALLRVQGRRADRQPAGR